jgi:hypothetical protein
MKENIVGSLEELGPLIQILIGLLGGGSSEGGGTTT